MFYFFTILSSIIKKKINNRSKIKSELIFSASHSHTAIPIARSISDSLHSSEHPIKRADIPRAIGLSSQDFRHIRHPEPMSIDLIRAPIRYLSSKLYLHCVRNDIFDSADNVIKSNSLLSANIVVECC